MRARWSCNRAGVLACLMACLLFSAVALNAQEESEVHVRPRVHEVPVKAENPALDTHTPMLKSNVDLVLVPVTVTDPDDRLVTGLEKKNFEIEEDKHQQVIENLSSDDAPVSIGILLDVSGSMKDKIDRAKEAVVEFLRAANPQDESFVITFADRPELISDFTRHTGDIRSKLAFAQANGMTSLLDAIYLGLNEMQHAQYRRKALLIISDGGDNHSRYTESEIRSVVQEADVQIFGIGLFDAAPPTEEERLGPQLLSDITNETGGRTYTIDSPDQLPDVATKIGVALRNEYVIAYRSAAKPRDGKWHKIRVRLHPPKGLPPLHVHAKRGYYAAAK